MRDRLRGVASIAVAAGFVVAGGMGSAHAVTVSIAFQDVGAGQVSPTTVASNTGLASGSGGDANFTFTASGSGSPPNGATKPLDSSSIDVSSLGGSGFFDVFVTVSDITTPLGSSVPFLSTFTTNALDSGMHVTLTTLLSTSDALYQGVALASQPFTGPDLLDTKAILTSANTGLGPYSLTAEYQVTANAAGESANDTITVQVPGPIVGAGLPGLMAACAGLLGLARRRRREA